MAADDIRAMSDALAADPSSLIFLTLAEALLARGEYSHAQRVATRGAARHPHRVDAQDLVARIALAQGDDTRAEVAWQKVLEISPGFGTAHRGLGFIHYRRGDLARALEHLEFARREDPDDASVIDAIAAVRTAMGQAAPDGGEVAVDEPASLAADDPATVFDDVLGDSPQVALLLEPDGVVSAGRYTTADGTDLGTIIGAHLSGVSDEAQRAMRHFKLGGWTRIVIETEAAVVAMAPAGEPVVLVAAPRDVPLGFARRTLDRCVAAARAWISAQEGA